ncbi:MAG: hypothetical protein ACTMUB_06080 [cyanobacterium endosymbiont of Rhopalodia musculus]|uniref:hypothetical protein n=1 Tax=cyanobacterium endosymbiont of Epithemia clementina EcSB TaxID=3034674 RepID=UPI00247FDE4C|nr:hypothetical protein [cyanobacterium endosymbiont of Epithemia clementina EcSB]WGT67703.1 hypothetical protein P3F56_00935 [cyanobacterium endosymbiont of Epithemia clementina EcSB]
MLERLLLASTVTCLLYFSVQVGRSSVNPTQTNQPFGYVMFESSSLPTSREVWADSAFSKSDSVLGQAIDQVIV